MNPMPDDVKEMLGIPIQSKSRSRSEPRTPRKTPSKVILVRHNWHWTVMVHTFNIHRWIQRSQGHHPKHPKRPNRNKIFITLQPWRKSLHSKRKGIKSMHFWRSLHQVEVARGSSLWPLQRWLTTSHRPALLPTLQEAAVFRTRSTWRMSSSLQPRQRQSSSKLQVILVLWLKGSYCLSCHRGRATANQWWRCWEAREEAAYLVSARRMGHCRGKPEGCWRLKCKILLRRIWKCKFNLIDPWY